MGPCSRGVAEDLYGEDPEGGFEEVDSEAMRRKPWKAGKHLCVY
jgi:hypothetical protein